MSYSSFASYYDALMRNVNYIRLCDYIEQILHKYNHQSGLTLDLACGTGSLTIELANRGFDIFGADCSNQMLSEAQRKSAEAGMQILFLRQKMQELDLYGTIDTCVCCLDSINHVTSKVDLQSAFDKVSLFMNKGGLFIFDCNTVYKHKKILSDNSFVYDTPAVFCVWQNKQMPENTVQISLDFFEPAKNGMYRHSSEHFSERAYSIDELSAMLANAGLCVKNIFNEYTFDSPPENAERLFFIAQKI